MEMTTETFESLLTAAAAKLTKEIRKDTNLHVPRTFEDRAREVLRGLAKESGIKVDEARPQTFPDIVLNAFGVEVKVANKDTWRSVANSVFEGTRNLDVKEVYVLFGKMGGVPEVRWGRYEDCVMHVRTSHVPRFEVEIGAKQSLFKKFGITYDKFCELPEEEKMQHIRKYARGRLKDGDRLWWLEDTSEPQHTLPLEVRLYMGLSQAEKKKCRAEAALLCPQVVKPSRAKKKYDDAALYLLTYRGVLCSQVRDLFSAGSVALKSNEKRGGIYIMRSLADLESEMKSAAKKLEDALFVEYWGKSVPPEKRISEWLTRADSFATDWKPSECMFLKKKG
jgi:hypothetical protein